MTNYIIIYFCKGIPSYIQIFEDQILKKYFILRIKNKLILRLLIQKKKYFTNHATLLFINYFFILKNNKILSKKNSLIKIIFKNFTFELSLKKIPNISSIILLKKSYFFKNQVVFNQKKTQLSIYQNYILHQSYKTNFVKIYEFASYIMFTYDINNHYAFVMSRNLPVNTILIKKVNLKSFFGILQTFDLAKKTTVFLNSPVGLTESFGGLTNFFWFKNSYSNNISMYYTNKIACKKKKSLVSIIDYTKYFKNRKLQKQSLVYIYGKFATTHLTFSKKKFLNLTPSFITNYSRTLMLKLNLYTNFLYSDTDSLFISGPVASKNLNGYIGYLKYIYRKYSIFFIYFLTEKKYCIFIVFKKKLFFLTTLNMRHHKKNFIKSYQLLFFYRRFAKSINFGWVDLGKSIHIKSLYKKKIIVLNYTNLKMLKTIFLKL